MKYERTGHWACVLLLLPILSTAALCEPETSGQTTSLEQVKQESQDLMRALKAYTADQKDAAIRQSSATLNSLDKRIDALETSIGNRWDKMDNSAREKARASLKYLRKQRIQAAESYGSLKSSSAGAWGHMKKGFSNAYMALHDAWEKSEQEFRVPDRDSVTGDQ